jgi:hypothetical protein
MLTEKDQEFLARRSKFIRAWPVVGGMLICLLIGFSIWLFLFRPLLANPFFVFSELKSQSIVPSNLSLMAGLLPVVVLMCLVLTLIVLIFAFVAFATEKRHSAVIQRLVRASSDKRPDETDGGGNAQ